MVNSIAEAKLQKSITTSKNNSLLLCYVTVNVPKSVSYVCNPDTPNPTILTASYVVSGSGQGTTCEEAFVAANQNANSKMPAAESAALSQLKDQCPPPII